MVIFIKPEEKPFVDIPYVWASPTTNCANGRNEWGPLQSSKFKCVKDWCYKKLFHTLYFNRNTQMTRFYYFEFYNDISYFFPFCMNFNEFVKLVVRSIYAKWRGNRSRILVVYSSEVFIICFGIVKQFCTCSMDKLLSRYLVVVYKSSSSSIKLCSPQFFLWSVCLVYRINKHFHKHTICLWFFGKHFLDDRRRRFVINYHKKKFFLPVAFVLLGLIVSICWNIVENETCYLSKSFGGIARSLKLCTEEREAKRGVAQRDFHLSFNHSCLVSKSQFSQLGSTGIFDISPNGHTL